MSILRDRQSTDPIGSVAQVVTRDDVLRMQAEVRAVTAKDSILDYITRLAMASREHPMVEVGISPAAPCSLTVWPRPMLIWRAGIM